MGTHSTISIVNRDQDGNVINIRSIYCHWDGYLDHNGRILFQYY